MTLAANAIAATAPRQIEVLDIGALAHRFMWFQRSMHIYRMILAYAALSLAFIVIPMTAATSLAALFGYAPLAGTAALAAMSLALLALCYAFAYVYRRCMAGSRRAVVL